MEFDLEEPVPSDMSRPVTEGVRDPSCPMGRLGEVRGERVSDEEPRPLSPVAGSERGLQEALMEARAA